VDSLTSAYIVGAALLIATPSLIFFGWLSDQIGRKPVIPGRHVVRRDHVLSAVFVAGNGHAAWHINYPIAIFIIFILVCYVGMVYGPVGAFLAEYFPGQDSVYVGVGAVSHRQTAGEADWCRSSLRRFSRPPQRRLRADLPIAVPAVCFVLALS